MWLGTEDGTIHIYNCTDNIRQTFPLNNIVANHSRHALEDFQQKIWLMHASGHWGIAFCAFSRTSEMYRYLEKNLYL
jgi:hypothetical protein